MSSGGQVRRQWAAWALIGGVSAVAAVLIAGAVPPAVQFVVEAPSAFWALALMAVLVDIPAFLLFRRIAGPPRTTLSVCFTFAIFLLWGAAPAIVVQALAAAAAGVGRRVTPRTFLLVARLVCALAAAEVAVVLAGERPLTISGAGLTGHDLVGFLLPSVVWFGVSFGLLVLARLILSSGTLTTAVAGLRDDGFATATAVLVLSPLLTTLSGWWPVLVAVPIFAWNQFSRELTHREQRARREPVTGLLSRRGLVIGTETLTADDALDPERLRRFGLVLVNVESVLEVNRTLGRALAERLVTAVGRLLVDAFGSDRVGRISGEAFVILLPGLTEENAVEQAERAVAVLATPVEVDGIPFALDPAAGVAVSPPHGRDFGSLVSRADLAMGDARRASVPAAMYVREAQDVAQRRIEIIAGLRAALQDPARWDEVAVVYQPQVDLRTGRLAGAEALVRWTHPEWGPIRPDELLEAVEPTEVIHLLTRHMLERVCVQLRAWDDRGIRLRVAVNASMQDLHDRDFPARIAGVLRRYGIPPPQLTIEITERTLLDDAQGVGRAAARIAALGVGLALDDFGTGYASMQQLRVLPLTEVKIDKSYVSGMTDNPALRAIVTSVHQLARALGISVVAEGVEDARTAAALAALPGTTGQGWYFGRPVPAADFEEQWHHAPRPARWSPRRRRLPTG